MKGTSNDRFRDAQEELKEDIEHHQVSDGERHGTNGGGRDRGGIEDPFSSNTASADPYSPLSKTSLTKRTSLHHEPRKMRVIKIPLMSNHYLSHRHSQYGLEHWRRQ